ncbi:hypothetical protein ACPA9J_04145 [Pseudomonas aeruginosa]
MQAIAPECARPLARTPGAGDPAPAPTRLPRRAGRRHPPTGADRGRA